MKKIINFESEKAIRLISKFFSVSNINDKKFRLFHSIRVWNYLYENWYEKDIVVAWFLHDMIEFTDISKQEIEKEFSKKIYKLILANSKDMSIKDSLERIDDLIKRCCKYGNDALAIKCADLIDSFKWYSEIDDNENLINYWLENVKAILKYKPSSFNDKILDELMFWYNKYN